MPLTTAHLEDTFASKEECTKTLLNSILNLNIQNELNEKTIINIINRLLSTAKYRREGLEYLNLIISNCSSTVIVENSLNWLNYCIIKYPDDVLRELKLRVIGEIIEASHNESDFCKKFVSDYISKVLDNCLTTCHVNLYECKTALKTLKICLKCYPSWFGPHKQKIENFALIFLNKDDKELVQNAALLFHYLQQVGGSGTNGINHKQNFTYNFHKLCHTVHKLYDSFFENERELFHSETAEEDTFEFQNNPALTTQANLHVNYKRIINVFTFIKILITTGYPVAKDTKPKKLLEIITRATTMHKCISGENVESLDTYQFSILLLDIQCRALKLLRLFIVWYQTNLLPFSYLISKTILDCIERSHNCDCFKLNSLYQESAYRALSQWITISKSSLHPQFQSQLLENILKHITPTQVQITLTITEGVSGKKSQRAKTRAMTNRIISSGNQSSVKEANTNFEKSTEKTTCKFALTALRSLLESSILRPVKAHLIYDLLKSIFKSLQNIQTGKPQHPYTDIQCQIKLYEVLVAIFQQDFVLTYLHTSLDILSRGANHSNIFISNVCNKGLRLLEPLCQPLCPSLCVGMEKNDENVNDNSSVDFDASTVNNSESENNLDISSEAEPYNVKLTDTDRSTIDGDNDDDKKDKDENVEEIFVEEMLENDTLIGNNDEFKISDIPIVSTPSENGEVNENAQEVLNEEPVNENEGLVINSDKAEGDSQENLSVARDNDKEAAEKDSNNISENAKEPEEEEENPNETFKRKISDEIVSEDSDAKKAKINENQDNEEDPDASYLEDDSFVDEVKDYY